MMEDDCMVAGDDTEGFGDGRAVGVRVGTVVGAAVGFQLVQAPVTAEQVAHRVEQAATTAIPAAVIKHTHQ